MADPTLDPDLAERLEVVKAGPTRETWLLRLLSATMAVLIALVLGVGALAVRIDRRAERTKAASEARDAVSAERERAQARALEAFRRLVVATTPEDRAAAREALKDASIPDVTTPTTLRPTTTTTPAVRTTTTTSPPTSPPTSTTTTTSNPQPQPEPQPSPTCIPTPLATVCTGGSP